MLSKYLKVYRPFKGRYVNKLIDFYGSNPTYNNPDFEDAEVQRTLRIVRLLYYTKIFRYAWRRWRAEAAKKIEVLVARACRWMQLQGSAMRAGQPEPRNPFVEPLDTDDANK